MQTNELPHDYTAERAVVSCLLIDGKSFDDIMDSGLENVDFYHPHYAMIFDSVKDLHYADQPVDFITVSSRLKELGKFETIGGQDALLEICEDQVSSANIGHYAKIVKDKSVVRNIVKKAAEVAEKGKSHSGDIQEFVSKVESDFFKLTNESKKAGLRDLRTFLKINLKDLEDDTRKKGEMSGIPTGFVDLDKRLLGMQPGQLIILAARPAMGKTALALNIAVNSCRQSGLGVSIFSLEMVAAELSQRILSSEAGVDGQRLRTKNFLDTDLRRMTQTVKDLANLPIFINDAGDVTLIDIRSQCRKIKSEQGLGLVIIDYLQLMQSHTKNPSREQQISEISRGLKNLAKELGCPIIALSQLNRAVESRTDKRPMVSDLRESGSIEQDADIVMMLYRDEVYNKDTKDVGIGEIIVGKNRAGETGTVKVAFIGSQTKFSNLAYRPGDGAGATSH